MNDGKRKPSVVSNVVNPVISPRLSISRGKNNSQLPHQTQVDICWERQAHQTPHGTNQYSIKQLSIWRHNRKILKQHVTTQVYEYLYKYGFNSYWLLPVQKHSRACQQIDSIAYRVDPNKFHDLKAFSGCSTEEHPALQQISENQPRSQHKLGKRPRTEKNVDNTRGSL